MLTGEQLADVLFELRTRLGYKIRRPFADRYGLVKETLRDWEQHLSDKKLDITAKVVFACVEHAELVRAIMEEKKIRTVTAPPTPAKTAEAMKAAAQISGTTISEVTANESPAKRETKRLKGIRGKLKGKKKTE